jgi:hypothetical protein
MLRLYDASEGGAAALLTTLEEQSSLLDAGVHARSRFRRVGDPGRFALYSVHTEGLPRLALGGDRLGEHTLVAVREFRRVPLAASSLALTLFTARPGCAVPVVAAIAHFVERAVDLYQPAYLLLAHSLEEPRTSLLLMAVHDAAGLAAGAPAPLNVDTLLPELTPLLAHAPEHYEYCPEPEAVPVSGAVSPYAV